MVCYDFILTENWQPPVNDILPASLLRGPWTHTSLECCNLKNLHVLNVISRGVVHPSVCPSVVCLLFRKFGKGVCGSLVAREIWRGGGGIRPPVV